MTGNLYETCARHLRAEELIAFTSELICIDTSNPPGNELEVAKRVAGKFGECGIKAQIDDLGDNRANVVAHLDGSRPGPHLVYSGHFDTVPPGSNWTRDPFGAAIEGGLMYGRGTSDMKAGVAAMVLAMGAIARAGVELKGRLTFAGTAGEEVNCYGAKEYAKKYGAEDVDAMVIGEASATKLFVAEKGALWLRFTSYGRSAHGGLAHQGVNALDNLLLLLEKLRGYDFGLPAHPMLGFSTLTLTSLHGGANTNVVPDHATATIDIRTTPGAEHDRILSFVEAAIADLHVGNEQSRIEYEVLNNYPPLGTPLEDPFVQLAMRTHQMVFGRPAEPTGVHYYTDAVAFMASKPSIPLIIYGPGDHTRNHKPDEYVETPQILDCARFYLALALDYLT